MGRFIPSGIEPHAGRSKKAARFIVLSCALLFATPLKLFSQPADTLRTFYVSARSFNIPFTPTETDPRIEFLLHVSTDRQNYRYVASARPNERRFQFTAPADGCYYFIVQTKDPIGAVSPANFQNTPPSICIWVDTQIPLIETLEPAPGGPLPAIHWKINKDRIKEIRAEYRLANSDQPMPLFLPPQAEGTHPFKPTLGGELEVRMWVQDKAGQWSAMKSVSLRVPDNVSGLRPPEPTGPSKIMHVKSKTFQLQYQLDNETVGPSRVVTVDIWKFRQGRGWQKCPEVGTPQGPAQVTVEASGRWGFRLIPRSGAGLAERDPQQGDTPDIWVEVDDKPPQVSITKVTVTQEADGGYLTVYWHADDTFLRAMPISIWWKDPKGGNWTPFAEELPNTGSWRHRTEDLKLGDGRYEFSLQVRAIDEAGNLCSVTWRDTVKVDLKVPRIKSININASGAPGGDGQEAQRYPNSLPSSADRTSNSPPSTFGAFPMGNQPSGAPAPSPLTGSGKSFDKLGPP